MERRDTRGSLVVALFIASLGTFLVWALELTSLSLYLVWGGLFMLVWCAIGVGLFISSFIPSLFRIVKFALVGGANTFVDLSVLNLLMMASGVYEGLLFGLFKGVSFLVALLHSYVWNAYWTFQDSEVNKKKVNLFIIISLGGLVVNVVSAYGIQLLFVSLGFSGQLFSTVAALGAVALSMVWNFVGYSKKVFIS